MAKRLCVDKSVELSVSNDAFFFLVDGEPMLDPDEGEVDVARVKTMFPYGFEVSKWDYEGTCNVLATFVPYELDPNTTFTLGMSLTTALHMECAYCEGDSFIEVRFVKAGVGVISDGRFAPRTPSVERNKHGLCYFKIGEPDKWSGLRSTFYIKNLMPIEELSKLRIPKYGWSK